MSSRQSSIKSTIGTIVPLVAKLMNQCRGMDRDFRFVSEKMLEDEKKQGIIIQVMRMTIVINMDTGEYIRHYWG
jgi:hypothetical protein